ncbi:MAG TPA: glycosyltransferase family 2 protein [Bacteroidota bacterium]|nr:glycosyltransferase family 2 protein [Bacteroidota bacterium]
MTSLSSDRQESTGHVPRVTILVTNWNGRECLEHCLTSIYEQTQGLPFEVIVVDDASTDDSVRMVQTLFPQANLLQTPRNLGFVGANNLGVRSARGAYTFLLNSDTVLLNDAVSILAAFLDQHTDVGICGPALTGADGSPQISYGWPPSLSQALIDALFLNDLFPGAGFPVRAKPVHPGHREPFPVQYVNGAALMIRTSLISTHGLFDERFKAYCEEVDLCKRTRQVAHAQVFVVPAAHILHHEGKSYGQLGAGRIRTVYQSYDKFLIKYHGKIYSAATRLLYAWHYMVKGIFRGIVYLFSPRPRRAERLQEMRHAWYNVRYSLWPYA